jgi:hypothetical protein
MNTKQRQGGRRRAVEIEERGCLSDFCGMRRWQFAIIEKRAKGMSTGSANATLDYTAK